MKKTLTLVFAMLMLIMTVATACGGGSNTTDTTGPDTSVPGTSEPATSKPWDEMTMAEQRATIDDELPEKDMDGMTFRFFISDNDRRLQEIGTIEDSGDLVDSAVINRNEKVAARYNVVFKGIVAYEGFTKGFTTATSSNLDTFDLALGNFTDFPAMTQEGYCYDWASLPYVDLDKPWYNQSARDALSVDGHTYCMVSDLELSTLSLSYCIFWNFDLADDYSLENIYDVVEDDRWTYDYLLNLAKTYYTDDGDGIKNEADYLAFAGDPFSGVVTWQYAFDNPIYKQEDGAPVFALDLEKQYDMVVKLNDLYWDAKGGFTKSWHAGMSTWLNGRLLAQAGMFEYYNNYREIDFNFGIVPYPKYDENQENFYTMSDGAHSGMAIPLSVKDIDNVSIIVEALSAESYKLVTPTYYETVLQNKYMNNDPRAIEMLDLIYSSVVFDFGYAYNSLLGNIAFQITKLVAANSDGTQSFYDAVADYNRIASQDIIDAFRKLNVTEE